VDDESEMHSILDDLHNDWRCPFLGDSLAVLKDLLLHREKEFQKDTTYGKTIPIIQSSGTGKSRLLDEISKEFLTVNFVLRRRGENGFPPGDYEITEFLHGNSIIYEVVHARVVALLVGTIAQCKRIKNLLALTS